MLRMLAKVLFFMKVFIGLYLIANIYNHQKREFIVELFDSFGREPRRKEILLALKNFHFLKYSTKQLQSCFTSTCGLYSVMYVLWRTKKFQNSLESFLNQFSENLLENDFKILRMFQEEFSHNFSVDKNVRS